MNRIDVRPHHMSRTQLIRASVPLCPIQSDQHALEIGPRLRVANPEQKIGRLHFGSPEIFAAVHSKQVGHCIIRSRLHQPRLPAECRRCVTHGGDDMAAILLTVAPSSHAVFPRFAPMDRAYADQDTTFRKRLVPLRLVHRSALFKRMIPAHVVIDACGQAG